jgi:hypothetical protein
MLALMAVQNVAKFAAPLPPELELLEELEPVPLPEVEVEVEVEVEPLLELEAWVPDEELVLDDPVAAGEVPPVLVPPDELEPFLFPLQATAQTAAIPTAQGRSMDYPPGFPAAGNFSRCPGPVAIR